jgi:antitoxin component YwqK of YwqJK toxin-antitoxin module
MKYVLPYILCFLALRTADVLAQTDNAQTNPNGYNRFYYPNGQVSSEGLMKNGKPDGFWKTYYVTGVLKSKGNRRNTLLDSTWVFYTETADTSEIINYREGKKSGWYYAYETTVETNRGNVHYLKTKELFVDDKRENQGITYYPSGKPKLVMPYRNGKRQGLAKEYDENGTIITMMEFRNDYMVSREFVNRTNEKGEKTGIWRTFYDNGAMHEEQIYKDGILDGNAKIYTETGRVLSDVAYRNGAVIEEDHAGTVEAMEIITYQKDEITPVRKGVYLGDVPVGMHIFYDNKGAPEKAINYNSDGVKTAEGPVNASEKREGLWTAWYPDGGIRSKGNYLNGYQNGEWEFYAQNGKTEQIGNFRSGVMEGEWRWFGKNSALLRSEIYARGLRNGLSVHYSDSAVIIAKGEYVEDECEGEWMVSTGDVREEGKYIMGLKNGVWKTYYENGKLCHKGAFVQGVPDGRHERYYPDGTLREEQYYVMGRKERTWKKYYENGVLFLSVTYRNNEEIRINGMRIEDVRKN